MENKFELEKPANQPERFNYKDRILKVINEAEEKVRVVSPDSVLHHELHAKRLLDSRKEALEFEPVRKDICDTFGITEENIIIFDANKNHSGPTEQRALRCFYILIDALNKTVFYAEGRTIHHLLLSKIIERMESGNKMINEEKVLTGIGSNPPTFLAFKGFLSVSAFKEISDSSRRVLETPLFDERRQLIETADDWFISGHNLEEMFPPSPEEEVDKIE